MNSKVDIKLEAQPIYSRFRQLYAHYSEVDVDELLSIYAGNVIFRDPVHTIQGFEALKSYLCSVNQNLTSCEFDFIDELITEDRGHITWEMVFSHKKLAGGRQCRLRGMTFIRFNDEGIYYHEDCYDLGAMVYENLPVMGKMISWVKSRVGK